MAPGHTRSYGGLARDVGGCGAGLGANLLAPIASCHRVLGAAGLAVGFSAGGGTVSKLPMLRQEGIERGQTLPLLDF